MAVVDKLPEYEAYELPLWQAALHAQTIGTSPFRVSDVAAVLTDASALHLATVGRLTAGMAHEFGTPLGVVLARAQMIREELSEARR